MSTPAAIAARPGLPGRPVASLRGPSLPRVISAEWAKLTSLRSPAVVAAVTVVVSGGLTYLAANASSTDPGFEPLDSLTTGLPLAQIGVLVLGILVGTGEFSTGAFRTTFAAVPRRLPVLVAQAVATAGFALLTAALAVGAAVLGILPAAGSRGVALDLTGADTPQVLAGMAAYLVGMALLGLAIGALLRRPVLAVVTSAALVLILPVALLLGSDAGGADPLAASASAPPQTGVVNTVVELLPGGAGSFLMPGSGNLDGAPDLGAWGGGAVLAAWILVPLAAAGLRLRRRDLA